MPSSRSERAEAANAGGRRKAAARAAAGEAAESLPEELRELIALSRELGADPDEVQGAGGNTSVKDREGKTMWIKASGVRLAEVDSSRGWVRLDLERLRAAFSRDDLLRIAWEEREAEILRVLESAVIEPRGARPSVDSFLHAAGDRVGIHTHPVGLIALLSVRRSRELAEDLARKVKARVLYVPYVDPGFRLARTIYEEIRKAERKGEGKPQVVLLENHGLFVSAPDARRAVSLARRLSVLGKQWIGGRRVNPRSRVSLSAASLDGALEAPGVLEVRGALLEGGAAPCLVRRDATEWAQRFAADADALKAASRGAFTPDQIYYAGARPLVLDSEKPADWKASVRKYREREGRDPRVVVLRGRGVFYAARELRSLRAVEETYRGAIAALLSAPRGGGPRFLSRARERFVAGWLLKPAKRAREPKFLGRVAVVTGAASGLGKAIARALALEGACVAALDVDAGALPEAGAGLPEGQWLGIRTDVTDERSVAEAFARAVATYGGIDYLVNAAGIAPSYPLVEFPAGAWRRTLEINLTGYFLCGREAARLLVRQGAGGAIVNLTSKSGLEASKDNSAYNATKAGEIHLARGWALELGRAGIRVNCVAPGNVFKGSRIWNEEYIRACARKKGIRPEEVIPYYISLSALGKEIEPEDIAEAVMFLLGDGARNITGQVLVVDGGQVMVR